MRRTVTAAAALLVTGLLGGCQKTPRSAESFCAVLAPEPVYKRDALELFSFSELARRLAAVAPAEVRADADAVHEWAKASAVDVLAFGDPMVDRAKEGLDQYARRTCGRPLFA